MAFQLEDLRAQYQDLFDSMQVADSRLTEIDRIVNRIVRHQSIYEAITQETAVPWQVIGALHSLESGLDFRTHLHNGDPLTARTVNVPAGRPRGNPPFTFQESAVDALEHDGLAGLDDWNLPATLFRLERFNGFGYRNLDPVINTPYLWSFCSHYTRGKFVRDRRFDPDAVSDQCGAAVLLRRMQERGIVSFAGQRQNALVAINGVDTTVPAFVERGNSWIAPRPLTRHIEGLAVLAVRNSPAFVITVGIRRQETGESDSDDIETRDFPARLIQGVGYVDASDLLRDFIGLGLDFTATTTPPRLQIIAPEELVSGIPTPAPVVPQPVASGPLSEAPLPLDTPFPQKLATIAREELRFFEDNNLSECGGNPAGSQRVALYWREGARINNRTGCNSEPWSAAFICFCLRKAGMPSVEFLFSPAHHTYIRWAIRNTRQNLPDKSYYGRRIEEYRPQPGDLVAQWRTPAPTPRPSFDSIPVGFFPSHCDIVVEASADRIITIGGNVSNRVKTTTFRAVDGLLEPTERLICVMECAKG